MRYKITLKPLQPYLFGGDNTFGEIGDKENGTYLVTSRFFPQQSAILGMLKKELMIQNKLLTRKIKGEWVDRNKTEDYIESKLDEETITNLIGDSIENDMTTFKFEKSKDYYLWTKQNKES